MATISSAYWRDADRIPITTDGLITIDSQTLTGSNETKAQALYTITGQVEIRALWGVVTTALGSNVTAAYWRLNDSSNQSDITLNTGTTLSSAGVGTIIVKKGLAAAALTSLTGAQERVSEPTTLETTYFSPFLAVAKNGTTTNIEFVYTTNQTPTTGAIDFYMRWLPLSSTANVTAL